MLQKLIPPDVHTHPSRRMIDPRKIRNNQHPNLLNNRRGYFRIRREGFSDLEAQSGHDLTRKDEGGGVIAPKYQDLVDMS